MFIQTGTNRLFAELAGEGLPVVVFESGMAEDHRTWSDVQPVIAQLTQTISYDRAGLGQSDPGKPPRTSHQMAVELHQLLHAAQLPAPYILVGHSLGGGNITLFAHLFPTETAGLIFIDTGFDELRLKAAVSPEQWAERERALLKYVPPFKPGQALERDVVNTSSQQAREARPLPNVPSIILSGLLINPDFPISDVEREIKLQTHRELAADLPQSEHILVPESRHYLQNDTPQIVIDAIERVVRKVRSATPLQK